MSDTSRYIVLGLFVFALGSCIGSFLNVVVYRLPRGLSLIKPPSHCPHCQTPLKWYDNVPIFGYLMRRGKCRQCGGPISCRYPIVEAATGAMFLFYFVMFFVAAAPWHVGPAPATADVVYSLGSVTYSVYWQMSIYNWHDLWVYFLYMFLLSGMLAASLIDAQTFNIPLEIPYCILPVALVFHSLLDGGGNRWNLGSLAMFHPLTGALAAGAALGLLLAVGLYWLGVIPQSFPQGEPILEVEREAFEEEIRQARAKGEEVGPLPPPYTAGQVRAEMGKEILFLLPPLVLGLGAVFLIQRVPAFHRYWMHLISPVARHTWIVGLLGSLLGAMVGALVVWATRIFGTIVFGRVAMGLGDVHLMFAVGAVLGAGPATVIFFLAPFLALVVALYMWVTRRQRELPYGPYLSLSTALVMLIYCPIADYLHPGAEAIGQMFHQLL